MVIGRVSDHKVLKEDSNDLSRITATIYRVKVIRRIKGNVRATFLVRSENTSSRFPMETSEEYLLFLNKEGNAYVVDSCGNSAKREHAANVISELVARNDTLRQ